MTFVSSHDRPEDFFPSRKGPRLAPIFIFPCLLSPSRGDTLNVVSLPIFWFLLVTRSFFLTQEMPILKTKFGQIYSNVLVVLGMVEQMQVPWLRKENSQSIFLKHHVTNLEVVFLPQTNLDTFPQNHRPLHFLKIQSVLPYKTKDKRRPCLASSYRPGTSKFILFLRPRPKPREKNPSVNRASHSLFSPTKFKPRVQNRKTHWQPSEKLVPEIGKVVEYRREICFLPRSFFLSSTICIDFSRRAFGVFSLSNYPANFNFPNKRFFSSFWPLSHWH